MTKKNLVYIVDKENVNLKKLLKKGYSQDYSFSGAKERLFPQICQFSQMHDANLAVYEVKEKDLSLKATVYSYPEVDFSSDIKFFKKEIVGINKSNEGYSILFF